MALFVQKSFLSATGAQKFTQPTYFSLTPLAKIISEKCDLGGNKFERPSDFSEKAPCVIFPRGAVRRE